MRKVVVNPLIEDDVAPEFCHGPAVRLEEADKSSEASNDVDGREANGQKEDEVSMFSVDVTYQR